MFHSCISCIRQTAIFGDEETAQEIIEKEKQGSISREFPSEWINSTLGEIEDATKKGDRKAQKAKKLLKDKNCTHMLKLLST